MNKTHRHVPSLIACALPLVLLFAACNNVTLGTVAVDARGDAPPKTVPACQTRADCRLIRDSCNSCQTCRGVGNAEPEPPMCGAPCVGSCADYVLDCVNGACFAAIPGQPFKQ